MMNLPYEMLYTNFVYCIEFLPNEISGKIMLYTNLEMCIELGYYYEAKCILKRDYKYDFITSIYKGNIKVLKFVDYSKFILIKDYTWLLIYDCVENGYLDILKFLNKNNCIEGKAVLYNYASKHGQLNIIKYLKSKKMSYCKDVMNYASQNGHLECLKYLHSIGAKYTNLTMSYAVENGNLECIKFLHSVGAKCSDSSMASAVHDGYLECAKYLHSIGVKGTDRMIFHAASNGHLEVVEFLKSVFQ